MSEQALLKPEAAAEFLAISERKLWSMTAGGEIPFLKIGRCVRYAASDLLAWIEAQKIPARAGALA